MTFTRWTTSSISIKSCFATTRSSVWSIALERLSTWATRRSCISFRVLFICRACSLLCLALFRTGLFIESFFHLIVNIFCFFALVLYHCDRSHNGELRVTRERVMRIGQCRERSLQGCQDGVLLGFLILQLRVFHRYF